MLTTTGSRAPSRGAPCARRLGLRLGAVALGVLLAACENTTSIPMITSAAPPRTAPATQPPQPTAATALVPAPPARAVETRPSERGPSPGPPPLASPPPVLSAPLPQPGAGPRLTLTPPSGYEEPVRVGLLLPLSGAGAAIGQALFNAAQLALFDAGDSRFMLMPRDTKGTPEGAGAAAEEVLAEGVELILGPVFAAEVVAVAPRARARRVNVISFSTDRQVATSGALVMGFLPRPQVARVVDHAIAQGLTRLAAIAPANGYGETVVAALRETAAARGAVVTQVEYYDPGETDLSPVVRRLANYDARRAALLAQRTELERRGDEISRRALERLGNLETIGEVSFQAVLLPEGGERLRALAALLPFFDIDPPAVRVLGTGQWDDPTLGTEPALVGGWFAAPPPAARADFVRRYRAAFGKVPPRLATLAYDATALAAVLGQGEDGPKFGLDSLTSPNGYAGIDGIFRFLPDGTVERGLAVLAVQERGQKVVAPAPETFQAATH